MELDEKTLAEIVQRILSVTRPERIILFGSAAAGNMTPDSDVDLLIVAPDAEKARKERPAIRRTLRGLGPSFDILVISKKWYEESKDVIGGLAYPATKYGRVIYVA